MDMDKFTELRKLGITRVTLMSAVYQNLCETMWPRERGKDYTNLVTVISYIETEYGKIFIDKEE